MGAHEQALAWAKANPDDPRAADIVAKVWAEKNPNDPRSEEILKKLEFKNSRVGSVVQGAQDTLGTLAKVSGTLRALTTGPLTGLALEAATGKKAFDLNDIKNAFDPTNLKMFPSNQEMMDRVNVHNPALSDAAPNVFADKNTEHPWYQPEKGGLLDFTAGGALQTVSDPAMYLGGGEAGAAAKALEEASTASKLAKTAAKPIQAAGWVTGAKPIAKAVEAVGDPLLAPISKIPLARSVLPVNTNEAINPLSMLTRATGNSLYGATIRPAEHEGERFGKDNVREALMKAGVWNPFTMSDKTREATNVLTGARGKLFQEAADAGARVDARAALAPGYAKVSALRALPSEMAQREADALQEELDGVLLRSEGTPARPPQGEPTIDKPWEMPENLGPDTPIYRGKTAEGEKGFWTLDPETAKLHAGDTGVVHVSRLGNIPQDIAAPGTYSGLFQGTPHIEAKLKGIPKQKYPAEAIPTTVEAPNPAFDPGSPGVPGNPMTPQEGSDLKTYYSNKVPKPARNAVVDPSQHAKNLSATAGGLKQAVVQSVEDSIGKGEDVQDLNDTLGGLLATRKSQAFIGNKADREVDNLLKPTGVDAVVAGGTYGITSNPLKALAAVVAKKGVQAAQMGTMPTGFALQKLGDTNVVDALNKMLQEAEQRQRRRSYNGQK